MSDPDAASTVEIATDELELWRRWHEHRDAAAREALIKQHLWLARALAFRFYKERRYDADLDAQELIQIASVGLLESTDRYDPDQGVPFSAFARKRIQGALQDGLDRLTEKRAQQALARRHRRQRLKSLTDQNSKLDPLSELIEVAVGLAIGMLLEDTPMFLDESRNNPGPYHAAELSLLREQFQQIVETLPERHRDVIRYHYYFDFSFAEIADLTNLTRARISQLHAAALASLRQRFSSVSAFDEFI